VVAGEAGGVVAAVAVEDADDGAEGRDGLEHLVDLGDGDGDLAVVAAREVTPPEEVVAALRVFPEEVEPGAGEVGQTPPHPEAATQGGRRTNGGRAGGGDYGCGGGGGGQVRGRLWPRTRRMGGEWSRAWGRRLAADLRMMMREAESEGATRVFGNRFYTV
jgi:hypothetical protein